MFQNYFRQNINMLHVDKTHELPNTQRGDVSCRRLKTSKHQVIGVGFVTVVSEWNLEIYVSQENRVLFRQKTYSKSQKEAVILGQFSRIFAERLVWKLLRTRSFIRTQPTIFELIRNTIGSQSAITQTPPKLAKNLSKRLLDTTPGRSPCRKTVRVNSPESVKASRKSLRFDAIPQPFLLCSSRWVTLKWTYLIWLTDLSLSNQHYHAAPIRKLRSWANGFFKIVGFACKRFLLSLPLPRHALFCARSNFRAAKKQKMPRTCGKPYGNACYAGYGLYEFTLLKRAEIDDET